MTAQLIVLGNFEVVDGTVVGPAKPKGKSTSPGTGKEAAPPVSLKPTPPKRPQLPPRFPFPTGHVAVFGQKPHDLGQFTDMSSLLAELHQGDKLRGGPSRTVFATVQDVGGLGSHSVKQGLARLPGELTILVKPGIL